MGKHDQWVSPRDDGWAVKGAGNSRDTRHFATQKEAEAFAKTVATNQRSEVVVQGRNGQIRSKDSFGNDPRSVHDTEH